MPKLPETGPSLLRHLRQQQRQMVRVAQSSAFARSGASVTAEGVTTVDGEHIVDGSETVNGPLAVTGAADFSGNTHIGGALDVDATANFDGNTTIGGSLGVTGPLGVHGTAAFDGSTTIGGDLTVAGTLSLPNGIVGNDALANMVAPASVQDSLVNFAIPTPSAIVRAKTLTVPANITSALVTVTVRVSAVNSTGALDSLVTHFKIGGASMTWTETVTVGAGGMGRTIATHTDVLTLLTPGSTFDVAVTAGCTAGWASSVLNTVWIDGYVLWFR